MGGGGEGGGGVVNAVFEAYAPRVVPCASP